MHPNSDPVTTQGDKASYSHLLKSMLWNLSIDKDGYLTELD